MIINIELINDVLYLAIHMLINKVERSEEYACSAAVISPENEFGMSISNSSLCRCDCFCTKPLEDYESTSSSPS